MINIAKYNLQAILEIKDKFTRKIVSAKDKADKFKTSLGNIGKQSEKASKQLTKFGSVAGKTSLKVGKVLGKTYLGIQSAISGVGLYALKSAGDFQQMQVQMETAFKGNRKLAEEYMKWATSFANETPFQTGDVITATTKLSMQDYDPKQYLEMIGDMASAMSKPLDQAIEAFLDAGKGEFERLKEFGITKDNIMEEVKKMKKQGLLDKTTLVFDKKGSIKNYEALDKVLRHMMGERFKDATKKSSKTLLGQWSTTLGKLQELIWSAMGSNSKDQKNTIIGRATEMLTRLNSWLSGEGGKKLDKWLKRIADSFLDLVDRVSKKFDEFLDWLDTQEGAKFIDNLNNMLENTVNLMTNLVQKVAELIGYGEKAKNMLNTGEGNTGLIGNKVKSGAVGLGVGSVVGSVAGGVLGSTIGPVGTAIGAKIGTVAGGYIGANLGASIYDTKQKFDKYREQGISLFPSLIDATIPKGGLLDLDNNNTEINKGLVDDIKNATTKKENSKVYNDNKSISLTFNVSKDMDEKMLAKYVNEEFNKQSDYLSLGVF